MCSLMLVFYHTFVSLVLGELALAASPSPRVLTGFFSFSSSCLSRDW